MVSLVGGRSVQGSSGRTDRLGTGFVPGNGEAEFVPCRFDSKGVHSLWWVEAGLIFDNLVVI